MSYDLVRNVFGVAAQEVRRDLEWDDVYKAVDAWRRDGATRYIRVTSRGEFMFACLRGRPGADWVSLRPALPEEAPGSA